MIAVDIRNILKIGQQNAASSEELNAQALTMMHTVNDVARLVGVKVDKSI